MGGNPGDPAGSFTDRKKVGTSDNKARTNDALQGVGRWRSTVEAG